MQPGDNFRVAAVGDDGYGLAQLGVRRDNVIGDYDDFYVPFTGDLQDLGAPSTPFEGEITEPLTVWRKLHVEVDSMEDSPLVISYDADDQATPIPDPDISAFYEAFPEAYVFPYRDTGNDESMLDWSYDFDNSPLTMEEYAYNHRQTPESGDYWAVYALSGYELPKPIWRDNDPDTEQASPATTHNPESDANEAIAEFSLLAEAVFEDITDQHDWSNELAADARAAAALHEIGHQFELNHSGATPWHVMWAPGSDMEEEYIPIIEPSFRAEDIDRIRTIIMP